MVYALKGHRCCDLVCLETWSMNTKLKLSLRSLTLAHKAHKHGHWRTLIALRLSDKLWIFTALQFYGQVFAFDTDLLHRGKKSLEKWQLPVHTEVGIRAVHWG